MYQLRIVGCRRMHTYRGRCEAFASGNISSGHIRDSVENQIAPTSGYDVARYTLFTFAAFALYRGGVLVAVSFFSKDVVGSYSLVLQALTILSAFALVPIQVWLARLVIAIHNGNQDEVIRETGPHISLRQSLVRHGNCLAVVVRQLAARLHWIQRFASGQRRLVDRCPGIHGRNQFVRPDQPIGNQTSIRIRPNVCRLCRRRSFVGLVRIPLSLGLIDSLIVLPAIVQLVVCLPLIINRACVELRTTPATFFTRVIQSAMTRD